MKKFKTTFYKKKNYAELYLYDLWDLKKENQLKQLLKIIEIFNGEYLLVNYDTDNKDKFTKFIYSIDIGAKLIYVNHKNYSSLKVMLKAEFSNKLFEFAAKEGGLLDAYFVQENMWENFIEKGVIEKGYYNAFFLINDNDESLLTFNTEKYDYIQTIDEIKRILN